MLVIKLLLQLLLFAVFLHMYGLAALNRLNKKSTIVIKTKRDTDGIQAPSFTISARSHATDMGWKEKHFTDEMRWNGNDTLVHLCKDSPTVEECLDSQTFNQREIIKGALIGLTTKLPLEEAEGQLWQPDFTNVWNGRSYTLHPKMRIGPEYHKDQLVILLDDGYMYDIFVHERKFFIWNDNHGALPSIYVKLLPNDSNEVKIYYKISATQHLEMNVPDDPCIEEDQYNFHVCVKESLARRVGCRPSWDVWSDQTIRNCTEIDEHR